MNFKEWFDNIEESIAGNLAALAGMALGAGGDKPAGVNPTAMVQKADDTIPRVHGVEIHVTKDRAVKMIEKAKKAIKNLELFKTIVLPGIANIQRDNFWMQKSLLSPGRYTRQRYTVEMSADEMAKMVDDYIDNLRLFASYKPELLVRGFNWGTDRNQQEYLIVQAMEFEREVLNKLSELKDRGNIKLVHEDEYRDKPLPDPRTPEQKDIENFTARWQDYLEKISRLPKTHDDKGKEKLNVLKTILWQIENILEKKKDE